MKRILFVWLMAIATLLFRTTYVSAEVPDPEKSTVVVPAVGSGSTLSRGTAAYGPTGIEAASNSMTAAAGAVPTTVSKGASPGGPTLTYREIPYNQLPASPLARGGLIVNNPLAARSACPPGQTGYFVYDPGGAAVGSVCVPDQAPPPPASTTVSPLQLAEQASAQQPWPNLAVGLNPEVGLTGLSSWFWLAGDPSMPDATASSGPLTVTVRATLADVTWDFGDGRRSGAGLGRPYPDQSGVQHVYETSSFSRREGYTVTAYVRYRVTYSVNGGPWAELGFKTRAFSRSYVVNQLQPEAVAR